jgi:hypothetical protein
MAASKSGKKQELSPKNPAVAFALSAVLVASMAYCTAQHSPDEQTGQPTDSPGAYGATIVRILCAEDFPVNDTPTIVDSWYNSLTSTDATRFTCMDNGTPVNPVEFGLIGPDQVAAETTGYGVSKAVYQLTYPYHPGTIPEATVDGPERGENPAIHSVTITRVSGAAEVEKQY